MFVDDLSKMLDKAEAAGTVTYTSGTVTSSGQQITWHGPLSAGESVTINYQVKVTSEGDRSLENVAFGKPAPVDLTSGRPIDGTTGKPVAPPADPANPGVTNPVGTEPVTPPTTCSAPSCASTTTAVHVPGAPTPTPTPSPKPPKLPVTGVGSLMGLAAALASAGALMAVAVVRRRDEE